MSKYLFYPGCSMTRSSRPYLDALFAVQDDLSLTLEEIQDWNCCGATEYASIHRLGAHALVGRNLALAAQQVDGSRTVVAGCSACYLNLAKTDRTMGEDSGLNDQVNQALAAGGLHYQPGTVDVRHLLDIVVHDVGLEAIRKRVTHPLTGLRVAPYYGCMIVRPDPDHRYSDQEYPTELDALLSALGATVIDFPLKTHCCGGHMAQISPPMAYELIQRLIRGAEQYHADLMVTLCPMCQLNLDAFQVDVNRHFNQSYDMPVLYFTQLMGLAFGYGPEVLGIGKEFVSARDALARIGVEVPAEDAPPPRARRRAKDDPSLPMPRMAQVEEEPG